MQRSIHVGAAQVGPIYKEEAREEVVERLIGLMEEAARRGVELVIVGWNTPLTHYRRAYEYSRLAEFHNMLSLQAGCYQNGAWAVGVAHCGEEEPGYVLMGQSMIVSPWGEVVSLATTIGDELIDAVIDLEAGRDIKEGVFNFELYRRPELYKVISETSGSKAS